MAETRTRVKDLFDLTEKVAVVTGASRGLGLQIAKALGEMGARIAITARKADEFDQARSELQHLGIEVWTGVNDLSHLDEIPALVETLLARFGAIDVLVNNAGTTWGAPAEDHPVEAWQKVMRLNVDAPFLLTREIGRRTMIPRRTGKIVNIASVAGLLGNPLGVTTIAYNTSKGAVVNFTRSLAAKWGRHNINVNAICPGFFRSKMTAATLDRLETDVLATTPLKRIGGEHDLMGTAVFLSSEASRHITGQCLAVDGGTSIV